ncbi:15829_t:CDS:2 [Funneliformis geosporum]|uniref:15829_t:CDS:1 n=1 Tax=Funneliformis geosporum TaxID=1117311 RepID=A0A9W4X4Y7_9GLOM|nr:15829_t:CDS:2 [Funneliformis geosporum]
MPNFLPNNQDNTAYKELKGTLLRQNYFEKWCIEAWLEGLTANDCAVARNFSKVSGSTAAAEDWADTNREKAPSPLTRPT